MFWHRKSSDRLPDSSLDVRREFERLQQQLAAVDQRVARMEQRLTPAEHRCLEGALASLGRAIGREEHCKTMDETV